MKFTQSWLSDHLETARSAEELAESLTMLGHEVEDCQDASQDLEGFVVGRVLTAVAHPNADRLRVCRVEIGGASPPVELICGAPNARPGILGIFAPTGVVIPSTGLVLKASTIRGVRSNGMLCSERELGLSDEHDTILELPGRWQPGDPAAVALERADPVFTVKIMPNRPDALSVRGLARDLSAAGMGELKPLEIPEDPGQFESPVRWHIETEPQTACPHVCGRYFRGVRNGPSPVWLQRRLRAIGLRPVSSLVDITNYLTHDLGRPLHMFDAAKLTGSSLAMRQGRAGETLLALDHRTYALDEDITVIADARGPCAIGGIMGGRASGCTAQTQDAFLESAFFVPARIARTGRRLALSSDARFRFERGVDPDSVRWGVMKATQMVLELCGGSASFVSQAGQPQAESRSFVVRLPELVRLGGHTDSTAPTLPAVQTILTQLGFTLQGHTAETVTVRPPSFRFNIHSERSVLEDILRLHGFDRVPAVSLPVLPRSGVRSSASLEAALRRVLACRGMSEVVSYSFANPRFIQKWYTPGGGSGSDSGPLVANPLSVEHEALRPSPLVTLLAAAGQNAARGEPYVALFEIGPGFVACTPEGQRSILAGVRLGVSERNWYQAGRAPTVYDIKADLLAALEGASAPVASLTVRQETPVAPLFHPGRTGGLYLGRRCVARFGELHPACCRELDMPPRAVAFELFLEELPAPRAKKHKTRPPFVPVRFHPVYRDFAFLWPEARPVQLLVQALEKAARPWVKSVHVFDVWAGDTVPEGQRSVGLAVAFQPQKEPLEEQALMALCDQLIEAGERAGGVLRRN